MTSFVSPKWVPQMADAEQVVAGIHAPARHASTRASISTARAWRARWRRSKLDVEGSLSVTASEAFSKKNTNRTIEETFAEDAAQRRGAEADEHPDA